MADHGTRTQHVMTIVCPLSIIIIHIINAVVCERYGPTEQMQGGLQVRYTVCTGISKRLYTIMSKDRE
jgi:hypothetical protein